MSLASGVQIHDDCITAFQDFSRSHGKTKYIIYKIADDKKSVVVDSVGKDQDYEVFRNELADAKDSQGRASPVTPSTMSSTRSPARERGAHSCNRNCSQIIFISWVPSETPTLWSMIYASTREVLKNALNVVTSIHADDKSDIEWKTVLKEASGGKA
ncbi:Actin-binding cofilin/tropomyosin type [Penicillium cf. griseofulvum]|uniref:Cofilin n=1 Tax=Penicillium cf. griseofulvum TaxID=2972120 RepID=A0A9W9JML8_9EURO|nr:Actin-binding cofilin/tropomyosin type [Penicillium cf. griseofulvum]KAJ5442472.1 Actin-binding cofilin/tropomyosin type [Penicillium cf. griseofulvum]